jgi:hypothetical protein
LVADAVPICVEVAQAEELTNESYQNFEELRMLVEEICTLPVICHEVSIENFIKYY